uniref:Uncharacterized protein n=1 Tax=Periophthalmus magnuspinnatus TaxID=409849 RepID=A0A3B3ZHR9_9GOBI
THFNIFKSYVCNVILKVQYVTFLVGLNAEMAAIRTAVIQHRLALDILLTEKGGVCKLINASCCFHIPDEFNNITDIIKHMQDSIQPPRQTNTSWLSWLESRLAVLDFNNDHAHSNDILPCMSSNPMFTEMHG